MNSLLRLSLAVALLPAALSVVPQAANAQTPQSDGGTMREGKTYVGLIGTRLDHRSIDKELAGQAWSTLGALQIGTHVTERFHAELRLGGGLASGKVDNELEVDIRYFVSWYFGGHYPLTDYANIYAQYGFTHLKGKAELTPFGRYRAETPQSELPGDLRGRTYEDIADGKYPDSSFSTSFLAGLEFEVMNDGYFFLEMGRFFKDTVTNANVFQFSGGLKYEF